jgi:HAD superfamily hydrolase (TIGR01509 family)
MIKTIISDLSRTILFPKDNTYSDSLNRLYKKLQEQDKNFNYFDYYKLNQELLDYYKRLKEAYELYIFTTGYVQDHPAVRPILDKIFEDIYNIESVGGLKKTDPNAFIKLAELTNRNPEEIVFIDDNTDNIKAASKAGLNTIVYTDVENLVEEFKKLTN